MYGSPPSPTYEPEEWGGGLVFPMGYNVCRSPANDPCPGGGLLRMLYSGGGKKRTKVWTYPPLSANLKTTDLRFNNKLAHPSFSRPAHFQNETNPITAFLAPPPLQHPHPLYQRRHNGGEVGGRGARRPHGVRSHPAGPRPRSHPHRRPPPRPQVELPVTYPLTIWYYNSCLRHSIFWVQLIHFFLDTDSIFLPLVFGESFCRSATPTGIYQTHPHEFFLACPPARAAVTCSTSGCTPIRSPTCLPRPRASMSPPFSDRIAFIHQQRCVRFWIVGKFPS